MSIDLSLILQTTRIQKQFPLSVFVFNDSLVVSATYCHLQFEAQLFQAMLNTVVYQMLIVTNVFVNSAAL